MHMYQVTTFKETLHQLPGGSGRGPHPQSVTSPPHYSTTQPLPANLWSKENLDSTSGSSDSFFGNNSRSVRGNGFLNGGDQPQVLQPICRQGQGRGPRLHFKSGGVLQENLIIPQTGPAEGMPRVPLAQPHFARPWSTDVVYHATQSLAPQKQQVLRPIRQAPRGSSPTHQQATQREDPPRVTAASIHQDPNPNLNPFLTRPMPVYGQTAERLTQITPGVSKFLLSSDQTLGSDNSWNYAPTARQAKRPNDFFRNASSAASPTRYARDGYGMQ